MVAEHIRRCAAIEDELESLGANKLLKELADLKGIIKNLLLQTEKDSFYDEISNWEAVKTIRHKDEWDIEKLRGELTNKQKARYITLRVDKDAIKEGVANGDLSRAKLEAVGAVNRAPYSYALYIRERKQDDPN